MSPWQHVPIHVSMAILNTWNYEQLSQTVFWPPMILWYSIIVQQYWATHPMTGLLHSLINLPGRCLWTFLKCFFNSRTLDPSFTMLEWFHFLTNLLEVTDSGESVPIESDFFFGYATPLTYVAFRDMDNGSWYITELCRFLCKHGASASLKDIHTRVNYEVSQLALWA